MDHGKDANSFVSVKLWMQMQTKLLLQYFWWVKQ